jgi:hypothetical protein
MNLEQVDAAVAEVFDRSNRSNREMTKDESLALYSAAIAVERLPADDQPPYLAPLLRAIAERLYRP